MRVRLWTARQLCWQDSLLFEIELAKVSQARENRRNASRMYNPMRVGGLATLAPIIPWVDYINNILTDKIIQVRGHYTAQQGGLIYDFFAI